MKKRVIATCLIVVLVITAVFVHAQSNNANQLTIAVFTGSYWDVPEQDSFGLLDTAIDTFCQKRACQIDYVTGITQNRYEEWLGEKYLKNEMPDLFFVPDDMFSEYIENGMLMELDSLISSDQTLQLDDYYDVSLSAVRMHDHFYALPYVSSPRLTLVNSDLLEKENMEMPDLNWTWDDMLRIYRTMNKDMNGILFQHGYTWELASYATENFFFNEEESTSNFASDEMISLVDFMRKFHESSEYSLSANAFENENVIFQPVSYSAYRTYTSYPYRLKYFGSQWRCVSLPTKEDGIKAIPVDTLSIGIYQGTKKRQLAWEFLKYLTTDYELQKQLMMKTPSVSVLKEVLHDQELQTMFAEANQKIDLSDLDHMMQNGVAALHTKKYTQVVELAESTMNALIANEQDIENNLIVLNRRITEFLSQYYK